MNKHEKQNKGSPTVLIADDEPEIRTVLSRFLMRQGYDAIQASNGKEALGMAKVQQPQIMLLDINMPEMDGLNVCKKLRENPATRLMPILMLTTRAAVEDRVLGLTTGADDYLPKPFDLQELQARIATLLKRSQNMVAANPLTQLPGSPGIQQEVERRIDSHRPFGVAYIDIDHFKAYNDTYGYHQGDKVLIWTAEVIQKVIDGDSGNSAGTPNFLGHIGGDDFVLVAEAGTIRELCCKIAEQFDTDKIQWYHLAHRLQKCIRAKDRQGNACNFPLMSLSIAISTNEKREMKHYGQIAQITSELKKFIKGRAEKGQSRIVEDRRLS